MRGNAGTSRALNRRLILNLLRNQGPVSRADLATATGLSPAAVTFVVADLMEESLVVEGKAVAGLPGRRPVPIDINYGGHLALGFKLNRRTIECVLTDLATTPLVAMTVEIDDVSAGGMIGAIVSTIPLLLSRSGSPASSVVGIGVSIPGEIDPKRGICLQSPRFGWRDLPFAAMLAERVHAPVWIDDDVNAFAVAQKLFGEGRNHATFAALAIGAGIGCSLVIDGKVHHGSRGAAGKLGHTISVHGGLRCECGRRGCLMAHAAEPYMVEELQRRTGADFSERAFAEAVATGDAPALAILEETGLRIGRHLAEVVNLFDPEIIVVGGEAVRFGEVFLDPIRRGLEDFTFFSKPPLVPDWVEHSWSRGAAALATQSFFDFERSPSGGVAG